MKPNKARLSLWLISLSFASASIRAQLPPPPPGPPALSAVEQLAAPIALYPDPLLSLILPASTHPDQIVWATKHPAFDADDLAVQGLQHYPDLLRWMATNIAWTQQLGAAFAADPAAVMAAIQDLRHRAKAAGTLVSTGYERVLLDPNGDIELLPGSDGNLYVPSYDPDLAFYGPAYFDWGEAWEMGPWLGYSVDWRKRRLHHGDEPWHPPAHVAVIRSPSMAQPQGQRPAIVRPALPARPHFSSGSSSFAHASPAPSPPSRAPTPSSSNKDGAHG